MANPCLYAAVLAGGRSIRMGRDKRFLQIHGEAFVDRALRLANEAVGGDVSRVFLCGDVPHHQSLPDVLPGLGPLGGLITVVSHILSKHPDEGTELLVMPVDMPLMDSSALRTLVTALGDAEIVRFKLSEMPFVLRVDEHARHVLATLVEETGSRRSIREYQQRMTTLTLGAEYVPSSFFTNVNSPQDWMSVNGGCSS